MIHENSGPWSASACSTKTRHDLEWDRLLSAIAERAPGPLGQRAALNLTFCTTRDGVFCALDEVKEAFELLQADEPLPTGAAPILDGAIDRLRIGGILGQSEILATTSLLAKARVLRRFLASRADRVPLLNKSCATDPKLDPIAEQIQRCFEPDGTLSDNASPKLKELRQERQTTRDRILNKLDDIMQRYGATLQDEYYTEREGRFVLPVRSDSHERFNGIVHGTSATGRTLFMEPRSVIPLGNKLKMTDADIEREETAIYSRLSGLLADVVESISAAQSAMAHAELKQAIAILARDIDLTFPRVVDDAMMDLIGARHPLLELDGVRVIPSDIEAKSGGALIVSGPNAGGKTVVLKTLGLAALMVRAGMPVACDPKSSVGLFESVASDMGDEQSISKNLSTFSAHVRNLAGILDVAGHGTLVLLDEIATGTDPRQGEALATGVLDGLCARGAAVACTTHYEGIKALALGDTRFSNASVGFDIATMSPTFRISMGVPGASSALAIAKRFGMPSLIIERAERYLGVEERGFDKLVAKLNDERRALELARSAVERELGLVRDRKRDLEAELDRQRNRERKILSEQTHGLLSAIKLAREDLRDAQQKLRGKSVSAETVRNAKKEIDRVAAKVAIGGELEQFQPGDGHPAALMSPDSVEVGMRVYIPRLRAEATVIDVHNQGRVRVSLGAVKLSASADELRAVPSQSAADTVGQTRRYHQRPKQPKPKSQFHSSADFSVPFQTSDNRCDLHGLRVDEAIAMVEQFLDRCLTQGMKVAFLIHGYGTGALRNAIRAAMAKSSYVERFRPGETSEGGDGVTVVWLR
ncbi:MAG: Smr/MutS family protein [Polyangiaceae bacterium]|nr:Smr/MutS family protein [Polyangiaceae bacterium]